MSAKEVDRLGVVRRVLERGLAQVKAAELLGLTARQVRRLCEAYQARGAAGLVSRRRGRPSNRRFSPEVRDRAVDLVRQRYADFGPTLAREKLDEIHGIKVAKETLRKWMVDADIWLPRDQQMPKPHQPRYRRECLGELVQIDGCEHAWFEERGPYCTLLVYVDDATGRLMELRFVQTESAFDYFASTVSYLRNHGKPVAFYSDKHSIFRVTQEGTTGRDRGVTQFGRALADLNIEIICANSPQAKGRVERMNHTLQDRLVKELRLQRISTMGDANAFVPEFIDDYNRRFGRAPRNPHDAHRSLRDDEDLDQVFSWQEERTMSRNLVVHFKRVTYLVEPNPKTVPLGRRRVQVRQWDDGRIEISCDGRRLPYTVFDKNPTVSQGEVIENKRLGAVLSVIRAAQDQRDQVRLASKKLTVREKDRIRAARVEATRPPSSALPAAPPKETSSSSGTDRLGSMLAFLNKVATEKKARAKQTNLLSNQRKQHRELEALKATATR